MVFAKSEAISGDVISCPRRSVLEQRRKGRKPLIRAHSLLISFSCCEYFPNDFCAGASSDLQPADVQIAYSNGRVFPRASSFFSACSLVLGVDSSASRENLPLALRRELRQITAKQEGGAKRGVRRAIATNQLFAAPSRFRQAVAAILRLCVASLVVAASLGFVRLCSFFCPFCSICRRYRVRNAGDDRRKRQRSEVWR